MTTQTADRMTQLPLEVQLRCCICLDTYADPVSIPCGHNFCLDCIEGFWDTKDQSQCPLCKETFRKRPELRVNRELADIVEIFKRLVTPAPNPEEEEAQNQNQLHNNEVPCDICHGHKSTSVRSCLVCQASYCELHLAPHLRDPALQRHRLTDPATFTCSHLCRKHNKPLTQFCRKDQTPVCEECAEKDHKRHAVVVIEKASRRVKSHLKETKAEVQQMVNARLRKMEQIKNSVDLSRKIKEREVQKSAQVCSLLISAVQRHQAELVEELAARQQEAERRAEELLEKLEEEIRELQLRSSELQHLELTQNPLHLLQSYPSLRELPSTRDWTEVVVHPDNCMETVSRSFCKLVDVCQELTNKLTAEEADKMQQYAVDVTLDPETASGWLLLSPDRKKVSSQKKKDPVTDNPQRFDACVCVLGKQSFRSGRCYWEVQVGDKTDWDLGVARESINRKGAISVRPDSGFWAICRRKGGSLRACASPSVALHSQEAPKKVGVYLDYEEGSVSFYDADAKTLIYTHRECDFTEPLYPYFNPCVQENGKNTAPLIICPLQGRDITIESDV
ncbi:E3 ubiquitin-protein ligase TRIM21-like [Xyrichtys novacula]|uniref:E3 ubiquitin-protein ligase TRIM21-like n=1 Tax=Xyrichtys novacula TaxID=13765 RepID=A0AAV1HL06_XYRNO|nr:E3 ubiquitin-protein ligase TRIM21-like [Xyrichtys novacula]